jgi:hypothetical protein
VALARPRCVYCGAALGDGVVASAARAAAPGAAAAGAASRTLVLLDLARADEDVLAHALGLSRYEARQRLARGGLQLHRVLPAEQAARECERLRGLVTIQVPEDEVRPSLAPVQVRGGGFESGVLQLLDRGGGPLRLARADVAALVHGPITREYAAQGPARPGRGASAGLEPGYRFQLHRREGAPIELDAWSFEFRERELGRSSLLTLTGWCLELARGRPRDDGFRLEPPALSPSQEAGDEASRALGARRPRDARSILDNLRQFRYYSGWRAACLRRANG